MKNIPLLQHEGIKANYSSMPKHPEDTGQTFQFHSLTEKINDSDIAPEVKTELLELVRSMALSLPEDDEELLRKYIIYLIRLEETRLKE